MILLKRFTDLRIGKKLGLLFGLIIFLGWLNGVFLFSLVNSEKQSGRIINVAGRQRMLTQKMSKEAIIIWSQNSTQEDLENIVATRTLFELSHYGLRYGDPSMGLPQMDTPTTISQWEIIDELWTEFRLSIITIEELYRTASSTQIDQISEQNIPIVNEIDILVGIFEEEARAKISLILLASLFSAIIITVVGTFCIIYINRAVSQPLIKVSETAKTIAEGNLAVEFNVEEKSRNDEIGILHVSLKNTQTTLRAKIEKSEQLFQDLQETKGQHHLLLEKLMEGVLLEDSENKITFLNPRMAEMLGYSEEELLRKDWSFLVPPEEIVKISEQNEQRRSGITSSYESILLAKNGQLVPVIVTATPIFTDSGIFDGALTVFTDITERKLAEKALLQSNQ